LNTLNKKKGLPFFIILLILFSVCECVCPVNGLVDNNIKAVTAITEVFGDGQKLIAIGCNKDISNAKLSKSTFSVKGKTTTKWILQ
jgi:predicted peptidase